MEDRPKLTRRRWSAMSIAQVTFGSAGALATLFVFVLLPRLDLHIPKYSPLTPLPLALYGLFLLPTRVILSEILGEPEGLPRVQSPLLTLAIVVFINTLLSVILGTMLGWAWTASSSKKK